jgi:hypothetical protein
MQQLQENLKTYMRISAHRAGSLDPAQLVEAVATQLSALGGRFRTKAETIEDCQTLAVYKVNSILRRPLVTMVLLTEPRELLPSVQGLGLYVALSHNYNAFRSVQKNKRTPIFPVANSPRGQASRIASSLSSYEDLLFDAPDRMVREVGMVVSRHMRRYSKTGNLGWIPCSAHGLTQTSKNPAALKKIETSLSALYPTMVSWLVYLPQVRTLEVMSKGRRFFYVFIPDGNSITDFHVEMANALLSKGEVVVVSNSEIPTEATEDFRNSVVLTLMSPNQLVEESPLFPVPLSVLAPKSPAPPECPNGTVGPNHLALALQHIKDYLDKDEHPSDSLGISFEG